MTRFSVLIAALCAVICLLLLSGCTSSVKTPASVLGLSDWKLEIPQKAKGSEFPKEIKQPSLESYSSQYLRLNKHGSAALLRVHVGDAVIPGSDFARSELRQMADHGTRKAAWSSGHGIHTLTVREAVKHLPAKTPSIVTAQVHAADDYVLLIRLDGDHLYVKADGEEKATLDPDYQLGDIYTVTITSHDGVFDVYYNGVRKLRYRYSSSSCYFKAGAYLQTNVAYGDKPDDYGEVAIYSLKVKESQ